MRQVVVGSWAGAWGDSAGAAAQVLGHPGLHYLVGDHLAEITMALLARARARDPQAGYIPDVVRTLAPLLGEIHARGARVVTNGGGLNPGACADALRQAAADAGVPLTIAHVDGDDLLPRHAELRAAGAHDMSTGEPLPEYVLTMNAYLGARPIADALAEGADIVVTGRCVDSAVVLGPLMYEFGWGAEDHDLLAAGSLVGHILECGPQATGGLFTDWEDVPGWEDMGYPVAECHADGTATITKPPGTGGLVSPATVAEQIVYEIGDPGAYALPDVICDWREAHLTPEGPDRVRVAGARGAPPTGLLKATVTVPDGFRLLTTALVTGNDAAARARRTGEAMLARGARAAGTEFADTSVEVVGDAARAVVKIGARHPDREPLEALARELATFGLIVQGLSGLIGGRPKPAPAIRVMSLLVHQRGHDQTRAPHQGGHVQTRAPHQGGHDQTRAPHQGGHVQTRARSSVHAFGGGSSGATVPLRAVAHGRSGDKGNDANIGIIARRPEYLPVIREQVTPERVAEIFRPHGPVECFELPGLHALNFLLHDVLGGRGGTTSLLYDPQGKGFAATLLDVEVQVSAALADELSLPASRPRSGP